MRFDKDFPCSIYRVINYSNIGHRVLLYKNASKPSFLLDASLTSQIETRLISGSASPISAIYHIFLNLTTS